MATVGAIFRAMEMRMAAMEQRLDMLTRLVEEMNDRLLAFARATRELRPQPTHLDSDDSDVIGPLGPRPDSDEMGDGIEPLGPRPDSDEMGDGLAALGPQPDLDSGQQARTIPRAGRSCANPRT